jgi:hypothetical protein
LRKCLFLVAFPVNVPPASPAPAMRGASAWSIESSVTPFAEKEKWNVRNSVSSHHKEVVFALRAQQHFLNAG